MHTKTNFSFQLFICMFLINSTKYGCDTNEIINISVTEIHTILIYLQILKYFQIMTNNTRLLYRLPLRRFAGAWINTGSIVIDLFFYVYKTVNKLHYSELKKHWFYSIFTDFIITFFNIINRSKDFLFDNRNVLSILNVNRLNFFLKI